METTTELRVTLGEIEHAYLYRHKVHNANVKFVVKKMIEHASKVRQLIQYMIRTHKIFILFYSV